MTKLILLCFLCLLSAYAVLSSPFSYKRHQNFYHHLPYHVNYSPYNYPRRSYYREPIYNDFDDHSSNEPVKGGIKSSHRNQIKTPMKVILERKNGYLSNVKTNQFQENSYETKYTNPSSTKQTSNYIKPVIYPNENETDKNENFDQFTKKIENPTKKNKKTKPSIEKQNKNSSKDNSQKPISTNNLKNDVKKEKNFEKKKDEMENTPKDIIKDASKDDLEDYEKPAEKEIKKEMNEKIVDKNSKKSEKVETTTVQSSSKTNDQTDSTKTKKTEQTSNFENTVSDNIKTNEEKKIDSTFSSTTINPVDTNKVVKSDLPDAKKMNNEIDNVNNDLTTPESIKTDSRKTEINTNAPVLDEKSVKEEKILEEIKPSLENLETKNPKTNNSLVDIPPPTNLNSETETTTSNFFLVN